jgi:Ca2+-binding EF-hand superfamily protein
MKKLAIGLLTLVSVSAMAQSRVVKFDIDNNGKVDFVELSAKCEVSKQLFEIADKNGDRVLSEVEMRTAKAYLFDRCNKENKNA